MTRRAFDDIRSTDHYEPIGSYRIPCRNEIAQRDERGVNPLQEGNLRHQIPILRKRITVVAIISDPQLTNGSAKPLH
jgi:hypothetical protein